MIEAAENHLDGRALPTADRHDQRERTTGFESSRRDGAIEIPVSLTESRLEPKLHEYVILGAGCAGLSLCYYLLKQGVTAPILILDRKERFEDDRTWCFWDVEPTPFSHLATARWNSWSVEAEGRRIVQTSQSYPYLCLTAANFYRHALRTIAAHPNVTLRLGETVESYKELGDETFVATRRRVYKARYVLDGRGLPPGSPVFEAARRDAVWVPQRFVGLRLRTSRDVFDTGTCKLMDFSVSQKRGLRFVYVLPFGSREALVENVYLAEGHTSSEEHRVEIQTYLESAYGLRPDEIVIDGEERGYIPMTDHRFPRKLGERAYAVGMLGGESRPSTGYTFVRIQRYCRALATALVQGDEPPTRIHPRRLEVLDAVFLRFMRARPELCPEIYARMFAGVPPDSLVRFLTEKSTPADEARLIGALPKKPFIGIAGRMLLGDRHAT